MDQKHRTYACNNYLSAVFRELRRKSIDGPERRTENSIQNMFFSSRCIDAYDGKGMLSRSNRSNCVRAFTVISATLHDHNVQTSGLHQASRDELDDGRF